MANLLLAQRLKELREYNNYTQEYVSSRMNIERPSYSNYELGKRTPPLELILSFAEFYGISVDDLLRNPHFTPCAATAEFSFFPLSNDEKKLLSLYRLFPSSAKQDILDYVEYKRQRRSL